MSRHAEQVQHDRAELLEVLAAADVAVPTETICRRVAPDLQWEAVYARVYADLNALAKQGTVRHHYSNGLTKTRWSLADPRARDADEDLADLERMLAAAETDDEWGTAR